MARSSRTRRSAGIRPLPHADLNAEGPYLLRDGTRRVMALFGALLAAVADLFCIYELLEHGKPVVLVLIVPLTVLVFYAWLTAGACVIADPNAEALVVKNAASTKQVLWSTITGFTLVQRNRPFTTIEFLVLERSDSPEIRLSGLGQYFFNGAPDPASRRLSALEDFRRELSGRLERHRGVLRGRAEQAAAAPTTSSTTSTHPSGNHNSTSTAGG